MIFWDLESPQIQNDFTIKPCSAFLYRREHFVANVSWKETGSQVLGSWNKEARANSGFYRVREATLAALCNW